MEVVYHTQETMLKMWNATRSAPLSFPSCVSSKGHLLAALESMREENRELLCRDTWPSSFTAYFLFHIAHLWRPYFGMGAFFFCGDVTMLLFLYWEKNFFEEHHHSSITNSGDAAISNSTCVLILKYVGVWKNSWHNKPSIEQIYFFKEILKNLCRNDLFIPL